MLKVSAGLPHGIKEGWISGYSEASSGRVFVLPNIEECPIRFFGWPRHFCLMASSTCGTGGSDCLDGLPIFGYGELRNTKTDLKG